MDSREQTLLRLPLGQLLETETMLSILGLMIAYYNAKRMDACGLRDYKLADQHGENQRTLAAMISLTSDKII